jgi:caa(3)-type oxidase subunit IV
MNPEYLVYGHVYFVLLILTLLTVGTAQWALSPVLAIGIALALATLKAGLIMGYFMGVRREKFAIYGVIGVGIFAVGILLLGLLPDVSLWR